MFLRFISSCFVMKSLVGRDITTVCCFAYSTTIGTWEGRGEWGGGGEPILFALKLKVRAASFTCTTNYFQKIFWCWSQVRTGYNSSSLLYQPQSSGFGNSFPFHGITWKYARKLWNFVADMVCGRFSGTTNDFAFITFPSSTFLRKLTSTSLSFPSYSNIIELIPAVSIISGG